MEERFKKEGIPYEVMPTKKAGDTFEFAKNIDLSKYSALLACGGDGSYHEVVNGMLHRTDGKRVPIGLVPNGSGNDVPKTLGFSYVEGALDAIVNRTVIQADLYKVLADHENLEDIPKGSGLEFCRYALDAVAIGTDSLVIKSANAFKPYFGNQAYTIAGYKLKCLGVDTNIWDLEVDDLPIETINSPEFYITHSKFRRASIF
jgi:diacylglycerol kinase family enzyme